jgi:hypothetical protein
MLSGMMASDYLSESAEPRSAVQVLCAAVTEGWHDVASASWAPCWARHAIDKRFACVLRQTAVRSCWGRPVRDVTGDSCN